MDPLFQKMSAAFDEGGSGGLLLNHLSCLDETSELYLDSNTVVPGLEEEQPEAAARSMVDLREFRGKKLWSSIFLVEGISLALSFHPPLGRCLDFATVSQLVIDNRARCQATSILVWYRSMSSPQQASRIRK